MGTPPTPRRAAPLWRRWLLNLAIVYLGILGMLLVLERRIIYHPVTAADHWADPPDARFQDVVLPLPTGEQVHAWWLPQPGAAGATLYCHGNAGNLSHRSRGCVRWAAELNNSVLIFDYPGFGKSTGTATEQTCYAAGEAAWTWLTREQRIEPRRVMLRGGSLGGAVAAELAARHDCRALVLIKAFSSIPDMAQQRFPWLPARYLVRHRYDNLAKLPRIHAPVFIAHGTADRVVPYAQGERLFAAANEPKEFMRLEGDDHNDPLPEEYFERLRRFLSAHPAE